MKMTKEKCDRAVKALQEQGHLASHVQAWPGDHGVWLEDVWNEGLKETTSFRIHDEEIEYWQSYASPL